MSAEQKQTRRKKSRDWTPALLLSPAFLVLIFVVLVPLLFSLYTSFTGYRLIRPESYITGLACGITKEYLAISTSGQRLDEQ